MPRLMLTDEHWSKLRHIMRQHGIYDKPNLRKIVEGILYRMRVGCLGATCHRFLVYGIQSINNLIVGPQKIN